jgi:hypothetical protein
LPRTFQLGGLRQSDWHLALERRQPLELGASHERAGPLPSANPAARSAEGRPVTAPRGEFDLELPGQGSVTRWTLRLAAVTMLVGGLVLIFLLVQATNNRLLYERYFTRLLWVNIAAAVVLALVILWGVYRLLSRLRRGKFGSRLLIKLAAIFGLVGVLPGLLIYGVSYQFVSRSIESWFDVKVEGALESGLTLARSSLETQARIRQPAARRRGPAGRHARRGGGPAAGAAAHADRRHRRQPVEQLGAADRQRRLSRFDLSPSPRRSCCATCAQGVATQIEGLDEAAVPRPAGSTPEARIRALALVGARTLGLPTRPPGRGGAAAAQRPGRKRPGRAGGQPRIPGARAGPPGPAPHVHRHPDAGAVPGRVRRGAAGGAAGQPAGHALLMLADGVRQVAAGDLRPKASCRARRAGGPDALVRRHDAPAGRRPRGGGRQHARGGCRAPTCRPSWTT